MGTKPGPQVESLGGTVDLGQKILCEGSIVLHVVHVFGSPFVREPWKFLSDLILLGPVPYSLLYLLHQLHCDVPRTTPNLCQTEVVLSTTFELRVTAQPSTPDCPS